MKKSKKKVRPKKKIISKKTASSLPTNRSGVLPLGDRVLIRPLTPEESGTVSAFGIIIPDTVDKEKPEQGIVVAVGPGKKNEDGKAIPVAVSVGDKVMFSKYGYDELKVGGKEYFILAEQNILAVLK